MTLFFNPAAAVGAFIVAPDGRVLVIRREHDPGRGLLGLPGGFVDYGETAEDALRREVREEVGIDLDGMTYFCSFPNEYAFAAVTYRTLDFFYVARSATVSAAQPLDQVSAIEWLDPERVDLDRVAFASLRNAFGLIRRNPRWYLSLVGSAASGFDK
ncbi:MAG: NUDIX domain-containing protein [Vicinamibacterales bacterium]